LDTESSCGVCGESLSEASSEGLEQLVHKAPEVRPIRKPNTVGLALMILGILMAGGGAALLFFQNGLGLILMFLGLVLTLSIVGGVGHAAGGLRDRSGGGQRAMRKTELEEKEKERKRRTGGED
jgi:hypothetical protein